MPRSLFPGEGFQHLAMRGEDFVPASGGPMGCGPVAVEEIVIIGGVLDHAVQRDVFDDFELSQLILYVLGCQHPFSTASTVCRLPNTTVSESIITYCGPVAALVQVFCSAGKTPVIMI